MAVVFHITSAVVAYAPSFDWAYAMFILCAALSGALGLWIGARVTNARIDGRAC
jgi:uncharacterized membrane protein YfcA